MVVDEKILKKAEKMVLKMTKGEEKNILETPFLLVSKKKKGDIILQKVENFLLIQRGV